MTKHKRPKPTSLREMKGTGGDWEANDIVKGLWALPIILIVFLYWLMGGR